VSGQDLLYCVQGTKPERKVPLGKRDLLSGGFLWISCGFRFMLRYA